MCVLEINSPKNIIRVPANTVLVAINLLRSCVPDHISLKYAVLRFLKSFSTFLLSLSSYRLMSFPIHSSSCVSHKSDPPHPADSPGSIPDPKLHALSTDVCFRLFFFLTPGTLSSFCCYSCCKFREKHPYEKEKKYLHLTRSFQYNDMCVLFAGAVDG